MCRKCRCVICLLSFKRRGVCVLKDKATYKICLCLTSPLTKDMNSLPHRKFLSLPYFPFYHLLLARLRKWVSVFACCRQSYLPLFGLSAICSPQDQRVTLFPCLSAIFMLEIFIARVPHEKGACAENTSSIENTLSKLEGPIKNKSTYLARRNLHS